MGINLITDKDQIIERASKYFKDNSLLDLVPFILENCPSTHTHSAFVRDIANKMRRTGKYDYYTTGGIESPNIYVFALPQKPFKERYWFLIAVIAYLIGLLTPTIQKSIEQKISQLSNQSAPAIEVKKDTSQKH